MIANDSNRLSQVQTPNCSRTPNLCVLSYISSIIKRAEMFRWSAAVNPQTTNKRFLVRRATNPEKTKVCTEWFCRKIRNGSRGSLGSKLSMEFLDMYHFWTSLQSIKKIFLYLRCQKLNNRREICASRRWFFVHFLKISHNYCTWDIIQQETSIRSSPSA